MIYPQKLSSRKSEKILKLLLIVSIIIAIILITINKLTSPRIPWSALANCGIIYIWMTVMYSIKKGTNIAGHVLVQIILISSVILYIDEKTGFKGWSINIAIPIILIVANIIMLILTIVNHKEYIKYAIYQLIIVLISLMTIILIIKKLIEIELLSKIAIIISILNLLLSLILCYKDVKEAIIRKFHM
ncbi:MAG: hypothetical protein IJE05_03145 [Clostridia bacterium]|nr:hypothetical protein [Clostridia bacterium]